MGYGKSNGHDRIPTFGAGSRQEAMSAAIDELDRVETEFAELKAN